jgi:hypothetical protein
MPDGVEVSVSSSQEDSHANLAKIGLDKAREELIVSKGLIESKINKNVMSLSYPWGQPDCFNARMASIAAQTGYILACGAFWSGVSRKQDLFALPR